MDGLGSQRNYSIASALAAMKKLGTETVVEFVIRSKMPDAMLEHTVQAALLSDQDRWILSLPVARVGEAPPTVFDEMTIIRTPIMPILDSEATSGHSVESLPDLNGLEAIAPGIDLCHAEQALRQTCAEDRENEDYEAWMP